MNIRGRARSGSPAIGAGTSARRCASEVEHFGVRVGVDEQALLACGTRERPGVVEQSPASAAAHGQRGQLARFAARARRIFN